MNPSATGLESFDSKIVILKEKLRSHVNAQLTENMRSFFGRKPKFVCFLSICDMKTRARVFQGTGNNIDTCWKNAVDKCKKFIKAYRFDVCWIKADLIREIRKYSIDQFIRYSTKARNFYLRDGIAFDPMFNLAFLEQEVNANVFIKKGKDKEQDSIHIDNVNFYLKTYRDIRFPVRLSNIQNVYLFSTCSYFFDSQCYPLCTEGLNSGRRQIDELSKELLFRLINASSTYLANQVDDTGKFVYGYFPCFNKEIEWYNMLRHASTTYSMIEAYEITQSDELKIGIQRAVDYLINEGIKRLCDEQGRQLAFVVERNDEIKLGANAAAILALTKYIEVFDDRSHLALTNALAEGIESMQDNESGAFVHVLDYPQLTVKERFRIIYYDGEAAFALMRLYGIDRDARWLRMVEKAFSHFIKEDYWKHHDHWLSYCTSELTKYKPLPEYVEFGLKNVSGKLNFILNRETTYPTFLELLMATVNMIDRIQSDSRFGALLDAFDRAKLMEAIEHRARHQLNGFFFPEAAMYFKSPETILGSFYIRHHSFRVRIDDVEHNISGYCNYYRTFAAGNACDSRLPTANAENEKGEPVHSGANDG
ncbi:hypothetical protein J27TS7_22670 [Paenibacillus dendritiformis]|uniref:hypothetical protein n=1 Tax=Paenibacillus dendritiformis TaxID=130049 RepID=UPI001B249A8E|nr:hypothetical protein [Paenibacillus dendritiformis]GIO72753.1 hypothetical protein J27TS7_22670 [Paenibacillus dendritiformis]